MDVCNTVDNVAFLQQTYLKKKEKKKEGEKEVKCQTDLAEAVKETTMLVSRRIDRGTAHE